jgi:HSP20 family protein
VHLVGKKKVMAQQEKGSYNVVGRAQAQRYHVYDAMVRPGRWIGVFRYQPWHPPTDLYETGAHYVVLVEIAGMSEGDFRISLADRTLTIAGIREDPSVKQACHQIEIPYGEFQSRVSLPGPVDREGIEATYTDGLLKIVLPKEPVHKVPVVQV